MGYRSELTLTIYERDYKKLIKRAREEDRLDFLRYAKLFRSKCEEEEIITLYWDWVKWYSEYSDVSFIESFMHSGIQYCFRRVGEELGDVEEESNDDDYILSQMTCAVCQIDITGDEVDIDEYLSSTEKCVSDKGLDSDIQDVDTEELIAIINS